MSTFPWYYFTGGLPKDWKDIPSYIFQIGRPTDQRELDFVSARVIILGVNIRNDNHPSMETLILFKNKVLKLGLNELLLYDNTNNGSSISDFDLEDMKIGHVLSMLNLMEVQSADNFSDISLVLWDIVPRNADEKVCESRLPSPTPGFKKWCQEELSKGADRKIPSQADVEELLFLDSGNLSIEDALNIADPSILWEVVVRARNIDGAWLRFGVEKYK